MAKAALATTWLLGAGGGKGTQEDEGDETVSGKGKVKSINSKSGGEGLCVRD